MTPIDWRIVERDLRCGVTESGARVTLTRRMFGGWWGWAVELPGGTRITGEPVPTTENAERAAELAAREHLEGA